MKTLSDLRWAVAGVVCVPKAGIIENIFQNNLSVRYGANWKFGSYSVLQM